MIPASRRSYPFAGIGCVRFLSCGRINPAFAIAATIADRLEFVMDLTTCEIPFLSLNLLVREPAFWRGRWRNTANWRSLLNRIFWTYRIKSSFREAPQEANADDRVIDSWQQWSDEQRETFVREPAPPRCSNMGSRLQALSIVRTGKSPSLDSLRFEPGDDFFAAGDSRL